MNHADFDGMLRSALLEALELDFPAGEELPQLPPAYLRWEKKLLAGPAAFARRARRPLWKKALGGVACVLLVATVALGGLFTFSPEARAWAERIWVTLFSDHANVTVQTEGEAVQGAAWRPGWLPEGYELESVDQLNFSTVVTYQKDHYYYLSLKYTTEEEATFSVNSEFHVLKEVTVNGNPGQLISAEGNRHDSHLIWADEESGAAFRLSGDLSDEELLRVAESVAPAEE